MDDNTDFTALPFPISSHHGTYHDGMCSIVEASRRPGVLTEPKFHKFLVDYH